MMKMLIMIAISLLLLGSEAFADPAIEFNGYLYESNNAPGVVGFPPSEPGDVLSGVGTIPRVGSQVDWNLDWVQLTWYITDLVSTGETPIGGSARLIEYQEGTMYIVADTYGSAGYTDFSYGLEPPNATSPSTFLDGTFYLIGQFYIFNMVYHPALNVGSFEGYLIWTGGSQIDNVVQPCFPYLVGGAVDPYAAPVPDGYDLEAVGEIYDMVIGIQEHSWGRIKVLYR
jgi:hypothetical protein